MRVQQPVVILSTLLPSAVCLRRRRASLPLLLACLATQQLRVGEGGGAIMSSAAVNRLDNADINSIAAFLNHLLRAWVLMIMAICKQ